MTRNSERKDNTSGMNVLKIKFKWNGWILF